MDETNPHKEENNCALLTVGGDCLNFDGVTTTQCASLSGKKFLWIELSPHPGEIQDYKIQGFILWYPHVVISLYVSPFILHTSVNHRPIWADIHWGQRLYIYLNSKVNAWPETVKKNLQSLLEKKYGKIWLWTNAPHPCTEETHFTWYCLRPCSGWFWDKVFKQTRFRAPQ